MTDKTLPVEYSAIKPQFYTRIPNDILIQLLQEQSKPWPDSAVWAYIFALAGFGDRQFTYKISNYATKTVQLKKYQFILSESRLAEISGRSRNTIHRLLQEVTRLVDTAPGRRNIYQLVKRQDNSKTAKRTMGNDAVISSITKGSSDSKLRPEEVIPEQHNKDLSFEKKSEKEILSNFSLEKEKSANGAFHPGQLFSNNSQKKYNSADWRERWKPKAIKWLRQLRDGMSQAQVEQLMLKYDISEKELG